MKFILSILFLLMLVVRLGAQSPAGPAASGPAAGPPRQSPVMLDKVEVNALRQTFLNSIDRKVYNVGKDIQSYTGSAADILQNIPSVQVDIDGNVSLRGDANVQILIDGRSTALMGKNRADVLSQMPADTIQRIEVITNPSTMYKPDGTAGIINIVLKKTRARGYSGSVRVTAGNGRRFGTNLSGNYNPGKYNLFGEFVLKQDDRVRVATDQRTFIDPATGQPVTTQTRTTEHGRPLSQIWRAGIEYNATKSDKLGEALTMDYRTFIRRAAELDTSTFGGAVTTAYDRLRTDPGYERDVESKTTYEHDFGSDDRALTAEFRAEHHTEEEDSRYINAYGVPAGPIKYDHTRIFTGEPGTEATVEYASPIGGESKFELGYDRSEDKSSQDHFREVEDPATSLWAVDTSITNRFILNQTVQALYGTYRRKFRNFGAMAGLRLEHADIRTDQVTTALVNDTRYNRVYPSLHLTYDLTETQQLQLNYSHRVRRPESDDLNPYPQYQDPYNLHEGNPYLKPQEVHSVETGYQYKRDDTTYIATVYYKYSYNGFTTVSRFLDATTLLTTEANLSKNSSGGLELAATVSPWSKLSLNASGDVFYNQIDASNLGYASNKSAVACAGKVSADYKASKSTTIQLNANYSAKRLTPQGYRLPIFVANIGLRHDLKNRNLSFVFTISDLFNTLSEETRLDTPVLRDDSTHRRASRIFYAGFIYTFGSSKKKQKNDALQYDNQL